MFRSIVEYCAEHEGYKCGYCKSPNTNYSHGMWAHALTVAAYQDLIDRGWRRSGKYCYKPTMDVTCCPMYTIRCRIVEFKASKSQKKVLKHFNKYLNHQDTPATSDNRKMSTCSADSDISEEGIEEVREQFLEKNKDYQDINLQDVIAIAAQSDNSKTDEHNQSEVTHIEKLNMEPVKVETKQQNVSKGIGQDPTKLPCKKAKQLRRERKLEKLKAQGIDITTLTDSKKIKEKQIEDFLNELSEEGKSKLEIKLVRTSPPSPEWIASAEVSHKLYVKYQTIIHNDKPEKCTVSSFQDFLVNSPLVEEYSSSGPPCGYGSFHQQYWLEGKLIAVGVIDILPKCVSSVYFFYDPQYMNLTLGTYGALREIAFTRQLNSLSPELKYYYMGYYIHSCQKMRYKGKFYPSDLLCPETYKWFPIENCIPKLEQSPYSRLDSNIDSVDDNYPKDSDINFIPLWIKGKVMLYRDYKIGDLQELRDYSRLVGAKTAKSLILVR